MDPRDGRPKFDIEKVDFEWVESTNNVKELKAALQGLIDDKGGYVQLEKAIQEKIMLLDPKSKAPENKLSVEEFASLESNISQWTKQMDDKDKLLSEKESKDIVISAAKSEKEKESGNDYLRSKDYEMALECYSRSIGLNPKNAASYFNRALVYLKQKQFNKAVDDCTSALENKKDYFKANHRRAKALIELKDFNAAISDLEIVLEKNPENNEATSELKMCREEIGKISGYRRINIIEADEEEEEEEEKEKEKNMPKVYEVFDEKPKIETKICEEEKALKVIKDIGDFEDFMKNVEEKKRNGNDFFKNEDFDSAIEEFSEAIDRIENSFREQEILLESRLLIITIALLNNRALAFSKLDCNNEAIQDSLKVLKLDLANVKALFRIAKCEANRSNFKEAKKRMGQVLQIDPSHSVAKADFEEYSKKFIEIDEVKNEPLTPRRASNVSENSEAFLDTSYKTLERRVSFKAEDIEELGLEKKNPSAKEYFKKLDAKYPKREEQEEDIEEVKSNRIEKDPEEFQLEFLKEKKMKKSTPVAISQETINNAKEIASKLTSSFEVPKTVLMFESAAKALKNDKMQFYNYIKKIPVDEIPSIFQNNEFSAEFIGQCIDSIENTELDIEWTINFFQKVPMTNRFSTVLKLLSRSEKSRLKAIFERLGSEDLVAEFKLN